MIVSLSWGCPPLESIRAIALLSALSAGFALTALGGAPVPLSQRAVVVTVLATGETGYAYVGTKRCRMCHTSQYKSWLASAKGRSWDALTPGVSAKAKIKVGLDAQKDYTTDTRCLACHAVGHGKPGGYAVPDPGDARAQRQAVARQGAGCEACHGPGSEFVKIMSDIYSTDRTYDPKELEAAGRLVVDATVCRRCHNEHAICVLEPGVLAGRSEHRARYEVDLSDRSGYHAQFPLKHRAGAASSTGAKQNTDPE